MKSDIFVKIASFSVLGIIFLSQFVPTTYVGIKVILLGTGLGATLVAILNGKLFFLRWQVLGIAFLVVCGLLYSTYGLIRGNPGAVRVLSLWLMWPLVYLVFSSLLSQPNGYAWLSKTYVAALTAVVLYSFLYLGNVSGIVPVSLYYELDQGQDIGFHDGYVEYNLYSISSLIFLISYYIHYLFEKYKRSNKVSWKSVLLIFAAVILALLTGRKAMLLVLFLLPFIVMFSNVYLANKHGLNFRFSGLLMLGVLVFGIASLAATFGIQYDAIVDMFLGGFEFSSGDASATERGLQFYALVDGWLNSSILFGAGNGASASISRSDKFPWAYELTYVYLLFSTGLVGVLVYFGWYVYGLMRLRSAIRKRPDLVVYAAPMLTASIAFCIAAASNPYFGKFDYLWIVLLPFLISGWAKYQNAVVLK